MSNDRKTEKNEDYLTTENVQEFRETSGDLRLNGYEIATEIYMKRLTEIIENSSSLNEIKNELETFIKDRITFQTYLREHFDFSNGGYRF